MVTLAASSLFSQLSPPELAALQARAEERHFPDGRDIFHEGDDGDGIYLIKTGGVRISGSAGETARQVYSRFKPGEVFGEMAVLEGKPRSASATAEGDTTVFFIPRDVLLQLIQKSPHLAIALVKEISQRLRESNRQYIQEVLQAERLTLVGRFARSIIHDLKNPLNIISLTAEMAAMDSSTPETRRYATNQILAMVERITEMVNEILEFTQGKSQGAFVAAATDYAGYVQALLKEIGPEIEIKSAFIEVENPPPSIKLHLDPKRLRRVFFNLIHNATDAMVRGGKITLRFKLTPTEVITEIQDSGSGIAPQIADHLFDAFATYGKAHGTGLGLSICKKIIEDHRGQISARNAPDGGGAIFSFTLPR
jgi:signal transduction histidine kinase